MVLENSDAVERQKKDLSLHIYGLCWLMTALYLIQVLK